MSKAESPSMIHFASLLCQFMDGSHHQMPWLALPPLMESGLGPLLLSHTWCLSLWKALLFLYSVNSYLAFRFQPDHYSGSPTNHAPPTIPLTCLTQHLSQVCCACYCKTLGPGWQEAQLILLIIVFPAFTTVLRPCLILKRIKINGLQMSNKLALNEWMNE